MIARNSNARSSDYRFLPDHPRPGHADMVESIWSEGSFDPRGGGSQSARLTLGLVAAGSQVRAILNKSGWSCCAHLSRGGDISAKPLMQLDRVKSLEEGSVMAKLNCRDPEAAIRMLDFIDQTRKEGDSLGSVVELKSKGSQSE